MAFDERAGRMVRRVGHGVGAEDEAVRAEGRPCFSVTSAPLHARRSIRMEKRVVVERLMTYGPPGVHLRTWA